MPLPAGTRLSHYEIRSHLGSGGMGDVYRARDLTLGRDVALKLLPPHFAGDADRLRRFEQEARSASALNHPAIVTVYELGQADGQPFISMEIVEGQTMRELLGSGSLSPRHALQVAAVLADALARAHGAGLVHRDLKPENLMVTTDGHAKILDFGLAKLVNGPTDLAELSTVAGAGTRPGTVLGTTAYMSPEQASGKPVDWRSDQFSFGLVLYEMLTGRRAFLRPTAAETLSAIIRDEPPPMESGGGILPAPLRWIVERCLAKMPEERYASTQDLARDLANARDRFSEISGSSAATTAPLRRATRRREAIAWIVAGVLGAAVLVLVAMGLGRDAEPVRPIRLTVAPPEGGAFVMGVGSAPFALSPDGRHLAVVATGSGRRQLWVRSFDSLELRPIAGTEGASGPFWSPDNLTVGFFADQKLKRVSIAGGEPATICEARSGAGATWNRDDVIVFAPGPDSALYRVPAGGGTPTQVTTLDPEHEESLHFAPVFLPDGRHFLFYVAGKDNAGLHVGSIDSPARQRLLPFTSGVAVGDPDWLFFMRNRALVAQRLDLERLELIGDETLIADGIAAFGPTSAVAASASRAIVYWTGDQNVRQLTWFRRDGTEAGPVGPPGGYVNIALSPDGQQIAVDRFDTDPSVWLIDVARGVPSRATFGSFYESTPVWAPDGRSFVFASARELPPNLFLKRLDAATDDERLVRSRLQSFPQSWSGTADAIVYVMIDPETRHDVWMLPMTGDRKPAPVLKTPYAEMYPRVSPDGRLLAYVSDESGQAAVYVTTFPVPGRKWRVSPGPGGFPVWRPDGRELFYRAADGTLMAVPVSGTSELQVGSSARLFRPNAVPGALGLGTFYDVARDGRFLVNVFVERRTPPAVVILNWSPAAAK